MDNFIEPSSRATRASLGLPRLSTIWHLVAVAGRGPFLHPTARSSELS